MIRQWVAADQQGLSGLHPFRLTSGEHRVAVHACAQGTVATLSAILLAARRVLAVLSSLWFSDFFLVSHMFTMQCCASSRPSTRASSTAVASYTVPRRGRHTTRAQGCNGHSQPRGGGDLLVPPTNASLCRPRS